MSMQMSSKKMTGNRNRLILRNFRTRKKPVMIKNLQIFDRNEKTWFKNKRTTNSELIRLEVEGNGSMTYNT